MKNIEFKVGIIPKTSDIIEVYNSSGINRPTKDSGRITKMYDNSNLVITAWLNNKLIGISRSITDFCYACYLSDLAVKENIKKTELEKGL